MATMPHCMTLQTAEMKDLEVSIESQDSQAIFDRYVAEYRIGVVREGPGPFLLFLSWWRRAAFPTFPSRFLASDWVHLIDRITGHLAATFFFSIATTQASKRRLR